MSYLGGHMRQDAAATAKFTFDIGLVTFPVRLNVASGTLHTAPLKHCFKCAMQTNFNDRDARQQSNR
jgi:hypothetical protein